MPLTPVPGFAGSSYYSRARGVSSARTINMRVEKTQDPAGTPLAPVLISKAPYVMYPRSGKKLFHNLPTGPHNGCWSNGYRTFWLAGGVLYEVTFNGGVAAHKAIGPIAMGTNPATMTVNGNQLLICSAGIPYVWDGTHPPYQPIINFANGTASVNGVNVTYVSGDVFAGPATGGGGAALGDYIQFNGQRYIIETVSADGLSLTINQNAGAFQNITFAIGTELLTGATCTFVDGYGIVGSPNSKGFRISHLEDFSLWDELDIAQSNATTDNIARVVNFYGQIGVFGDYNSSEIWGDSGNVDFPFSPIKGSTIKMGTTAPWSPAELPDGSWIWYMSSDAGEGQLVRGAGGAPTVISDPAFAFAVQKYSKTYDAIGTTYIENGHQFYRIDFPAANKTWEYDATTGTIVEIGVATTVEEIYGADLGRFICHVTWPSGQKMLLAGDYTSGKIWQVDPSYTTDDGVDIPIMRISPHVNVNLERTKCKAFALDCEMGTIDPTAVGPDGKALVPTIQLYYSDDGGFRYVDAGAASLGRAGEYEGTFVYPYEQLDTTPNSQTFPQEFEPWPIWRALGSFKFARTFKLKSNARMVRSIYNAFVDLAK